MKKLKVVLVEDEEIVLKELKDTINWDALGLEVVGSAKDGIEGERMIRSLLPDIVVTDIKLPGKNGLKMMEDAAVTYGIILSGYTDFEYTRKAIQLGVFDYIEKPVDDEELEKSLSNLSHKIREEDNAIKSMRHADAIKLSDNVQSFSIKTAIDYINKNYMNAISLSDIARETRLSESHLSSLFKAETGINFLNYLNGVRINKALTLLSSSNMNISEIAYNTGFPSPGYFSKLFRRYIGKTPTEYRNELSGEEISDSGLE